MCGSDVVRDNETRTGRFSPLIPRLTPISYTYCPMKITQDQVLDFARWTGDCNPIHVDPVAAKESAFGGTICHGMLVLIEALRLGDFNHLESQGSIRRLDVQFRGEVRPEKSYSNQFESSATGLAGKVLHDRSVQMEVVADWKACSEPNSFDWARSARVSATRSGIHDKPSFWTPEEFRNGEVTLGLHQFGEHQVLPDSRCSLLHEQVLGLCSFIVGMKVPGLSSLFTKLTVEFFEDPAATQEILYRLTLLSYDENFRILEMRVDVASSDSVPVATCHIQCYVRFANQLTASASYATLLADEIQTEPKLAVICGASRGLGAEIAIGLSAANCRILLVSRNRSSVTEAICNDAKLQGGIAEVVLGDIGDASFCESLALSLREKGQSIDLLVLNACEPPVHGAVGALDIDQSLGYVNRNLRLFLSPLQSLLPLVGQARGCVVGVSSSFVEEMPGGFSDYISVKTALETSLRVAAKEQVQTQFLIARPPKLQTTWNDTPTASLGAIPVRDAALAIVKSALGRIAEPTKSNRQNLEVLSNFPKNKWRRNLSDQDSLRLAIVANFTLDPIRPCFQAWSDALDRRFDAHIAPYNQILQELLNPVSDVSRATHGSTVMLRFGDWIKELAESVRNVPDQVDAFLLESVRELGNALREHRSFAKGATLVLVCPNSPDDFVGRVDEQKLFDALARELATAPGVNLWSARDYHAKYSVPDSGYTDPLRNEIGHIPYTDDYFAFLSTLIVRFFTRKTSLPKKVVVLDCDNTLWGGVVGEVGAQGVAITPAHLRLIEKLKELSLGGVLLCLASKNEPEDVWQVFDTRDDFKLTRDEIVGAKINWMPKSQNIHQLASELNLGLDSFIFLDDNPVECAEVRAGCPSVLTIQWPHDESSALRLVDHLWELDLVAVTKEDRERTRMYKEEFERQQVQKGSSSFQDFIDSLGLVVEFKNVASEDISRASQLTLRTNQFNLTTTRRNESEIKELSDREEYDVCTLSVRDRFGDYGVVGLFIGVSDSALGIYEVDTFLLSCRVLGRGVEHKIVAEIARRALDRACPSVRWRFRPTEKNRPACLFLEKTLGLTIGQAAPFEGITPASELQDLSYRVVGQEPTESEQENDSTKQAPAAANTFVEKNRRREIQIEQTVKSFSDYSGLSATIAIGSNIAPETENRLDENTQKSSIGREDVQATVVRVFSEVLKRPEESILELDRLDNLGCDSLQIVGITVALSKSLANLPPTLLFEHRSVSEIIDHIVELRQTKSRPSLNRAIVGSQQDLLDKMPSKDDVAIVGISVQTAAGLGCDSLWNTLLHSQRRVTRVPVTREDFVGDLQADAPYFAALLPNVSGFDPEFFGVSPREAQYMDPQLRLLLEAAWHAIEDAGGFRPQVDPSTGVFVGYMYQCYGRFANQIAATSGSVYRCWEGFSFANRISQFLGFSGPSLAIDTACSSSATALHFACESLRRGDCSNAIVAGVNTIVDPSRIIQLGNLGILTPTGTCVPFGDGADGTVIGEGTVCIYLKPLADAIANEDRIYAVIKGTGVSVGAGSVGFTAPNPVAQSLAIRAALLDARIDPRTIGYVETHGTGTQLGDPIEVRGLEMAYCDTTLWDQDIQCQAHTGIGSIKPNIGHLEAGAGLVGVVKAALQLHHKTLLPSITSDRPNPQIHFGKLPFKIQTKAQDWKPLEILRKSTGDSETLPLRAGVNSFGVGGSNAHIVLEESPRVHPQSSATERSWHLLTLQAPTPEALRLQAKRWSLFLKDQTSETIGDALYSNLVGRKNFEFKLAMPVEDIQLASSQLDRWNGSDTESTDTEILSGNALWKKSNRIAYLFTGQGAQYPGMLRQLYEQSPVFKQAVDQCSAEIDPKLQVPIQNILFEPDDSSDPLIHQTRYTQPAIFIAQYGLFKLWESYGVKPDYVLGHSIGEIAAYCATGGCSLADALKLVQARGELMQGLSSGGGMTSVAASAQTVESIFAESGADLAIAAYNGPNQTVVSGSLEQIASFVERAQAAGIKTQALKVSHAFHSKWMEPMLEEFRAVVAGLKLGVPGVEFISTVTATAAQRELASPEYWVDQVRQPVRFMQAMETLASKSVSHFIEIGPHPVLTTMSRSIDLPNTDDSTRWLSSSRRGQTDWSVLLSSLGQLFVDGYPIDWKTAESAYARHRVSIPGYEFSNRRIWLDEMDSLVARPGESDYAVGQARNESTENRLLYKVRWRRSGVTEQSIASSTGKEDEPKSWLILSVGDESLGKRLESQLASRVGSVRLIRWNPLHADWGLQPSDCAGVDRIVLAAGDGTRTLGNADKVQQLCASQIDAFSKALSMIQWAKADKVFWLVTQGARFEDQQPALSPIDAPLWGGAKVASIELPEAWGGAIDTKDSQESIRRAIHLIQGDSSEDQVILIDDGLWVPRLEPLSVAPARKETTDSLLGHRVVITGGLGAIGLRLAEYAVSHEVKELVLVGRNMQPTADQQQRLDQWHKSGVSVQLVAVDISSQEGIAKLAASLEGKQIDSVLHTAGIDFLSPIAKWTTDDVRRVTQAKIQGAWNLHQWSLSHPIKQFVLTSSIASIWGAPDRFLYASANAFLDALGDWRVSQKLPVTVLNFGPWADGGMADQKSLDEYRRVGMHGLDPSKTIASIGRLLQHGVAQAVITDTQWDRFTSVLSARRARPFFESLLDDQSLSSSASVPADRTETRVSAGAKTSGVAQEPWLAELSRLDKASQASELKRLVRKELSEVLKSQEERISLDRNLYRLGLDSITAVELSMKLKKSTGIAAGKWLAGEPTVESVATGLLDSLQSKLLSVAQSPKNGATATPYASAADAGAMKKNLSAPWASELESLASQEQKREKLIDLFSRELERFIGKNGSKISGSTRMADLGLDSLGTVDFATHLRKQLGLSTPPKLMQYARLEDWIESIIAPRIDRSVPVNAPSVSDAIRVELYESNMHDSVINFCNQAWPKRSGELVKQRWDWMFLKSAERLGVSPAVWIARERSAIIGHMGSQFTTLKTPRGKVVVPWLVDTMILEQYRQKGIGSQIMLQAEEDMPIALSLGQTAEIRKILDSLGWKKICPLHIHVFMNRPDRVLRGKLPMGVDRLAGAYMTLSGARRRALQASRSQEIQVRRVERFDSSHDALWEQMSKGVSYLAVRDSSYLNWKYVEQPGQSYDCWEVFRSNRLLGAFVTKTEEPNAIYAYRRNLWVDVLCALDPDTIDTVIHGCISSSEILRADAISIQLTHRLIEERLVAQGFVSRQETRYLYASRGLMESHGDLGDFDWLVNQGDSDIDRPE